MWKIFIEFGSSVWAVETDKQTDRHTDTHTDRQTDRQTEKVNTEDPLFRFSFFFLNKERSNNKKHQFTKKQKENRGRQLKALYHGFHQTDSYN